MDQLRILKRTLAVVSVLVASANLAFSQTNAVASLNEPSAPSKPSTSRSAGRSATDESAQVLAGFIEAEAKVREALNQHAFKRDVVLQTIGPNGEVTGEYIRNSQFVFDDRGRRIERVLYHPKSTIREMRITKEDIQDLAEAQLLGIDISEVTKYRLTYVGIETVDSQQFYAVEVSPVNQPDPHRMKERYFIGRVWLDPRTFQIAKIKGIVEPQGKQRFPIFETWREPIKSELAFPSRTEADDILHFATSDVHYRIKVRYYDYKLFGSKVTVRDLEEPVEKNSGTQPISRVNVAPSKEEPSVPAMKPSQSVGPTTPSNSSGNKGYQTVPCATNRSAPPIGPYHWPADSEVKVFFMRDMFGPEQRAALLEAMASWTNAGQENGSGVRFTAGGETSTRMSCRGCLTVGRKDVYKRDKHHYAFFYPMSEQEGRLISAWIDLDFGITKSKALKGFMVHELGHGLGLWDCTNCKKKQTIMNGFSSMNSDNGLVLPSLCDLATVRDVYKSDRSIASAKPQAGKSEAAGANRVGNITREPEAASVSSNNSKHGGIGINNQPGGGNAESKSPDVKTSGANSFQPTFTFAPIPPGKQNFNSSRSNDRANSWFRLTLEHNSPENQK